MIGQDDDIMAAIVTSLNHLGEVSLGGNCIGSNGATLISNCLRSNPGLRFLDLGENLLNDDDAIMLAGSLKTNTKLRKLVLRGNYITQVGIRALSIAVLSLFDLNALHDSNHTCCLDIGEDDVLSKFNSFVDSEVNWKVKILGALVLHNEGYTNIFHIEDAPIEIMPRVLAFLQEEEGNEVMDPSRYNSLNAGFMLMREWNMPLLYSSCIGPELRRSERIRKKMIMHYMGK